LNNIENTVKSKAYSLGNNKNKIYNLVHDECTKLQNENNGTSPIIPSISRAADIVYEESCAFAVELIIKTLEELTQHPFFQENE
jgi:hypothetical protein